MKLALLAAAMLTVAVGCNDSNASAPTSPATSMNPSSATSAPARRSLSTVLTVGDGVMFDAQPAVAAALAPARQIGDAYFGSGLTRPDQYDWEKGWSRLIATERPEVVVVLTGVWDARATIVVDGQSLNIGRPEWVQYYRGRVARAVDVLTAGGAMVAWVLPLAESDADKSARLAIVDETIRAAVDTDPRVVLVDGDRVLSGASNQFLAKVSNGTPLRKADGEHLCPAGAAAVAQGLRDALQSRFLLSPTWDRAGSWTTDDRYRNRNEGCTG